MTALDTASAVLIAIGLIASASLAALSIRDWQRTHRRWAYRAALMSTTVVIVWLGFGATLAGRVHALPSELAQMFALGARATLFALVAWLLIVHRREPHS